MLEEVRANPGTSDSKPLHMGFQVLAFTDSKWIFVHKAAYSIIII